VFGYLVRRIAWAIVVMATVACLTFLLIYVLPVDPAKLLAGGSHARADDVARISAALGLDRPFHEQFLRYVGRLLTGDLGVSFSNRLPVFDLILGRLPATIQLVFAAIAIQLLIGLPLGVAAATRRGGRLDRVAQLLSSVGVAAPPFWVGYLLLLVLAFVPALAGFNLFALGGYQPLDFSHLFLPAFTLAIPGIGYYVLLMRASMLEELPRSYIVMARSKGLTERRIVWRHAVRNAITPVLTQLGLDMGLFLGGVVVIEEVFSWPGIGKLAVDAIERADAPVILGTVLFGTLTIVIANLLVDVAYGYLDPRIRASR
jgi:peptide/nickel transport system permease protein